MSETDLRIALTTVGDRASADRIAHALVDERLAACVTILPAAHSVYRWQGAVEAADELLLVIKTTAAAWPGLAARLPALHPYTLPELVALAPADASPAYAAWVRESVE